MSTIKIVADVCIVCALESEGRTAVETFQIHSQCKFEQKRFKDIDRVRHYYHSIITNNKNNNIVITISWPETEGGPAMQRLVDSMIIEFHPRIIIMTGICAGKRGSVALGDLIIASKTFLADTGKVINENGGKKLLPEGHIIALNDELLEWAHHFDKWKTPVDNLYSSYFLKSTDHVNLHISPMATFSAVRGDDPFEQLRNSVRKTESLDMEGYYFYSAANNRKFVNSIIIKGVADFADTDKNDDFHPFARTASALYAMYFVQEYVNDDDMPRQTASNNRFCYFDGEAIKFMQPNNMYSQIPCHLSSIEPLSDAEISFLIKDWKKIHTASEILYNSIRKLPQHLIKLKFKLNDQASKQDLQEHAISTIIEFEHQFKYFNKETQKIHPSIQNLECISEIRDLYGCIIPLTHIVNLSSNQASIEDSIILANQICSLIFELLSRADRFIEKGLNNL